MAHLHSLHEDDIYFNIDPFSRQIEYESDEPIIIAQKDHNSELFTFGIPRYIEGHDMMQCNLVQAHYINIASDSRTKRNTGLFEITDLHVDPENENFLICSWLVSSNATMFIGSLSFTLRLACISGSKVDYSWNTAVFSAVNVVETIDNSDIVVEQYPDVLQAWYMELMSAGDTGVNIVDAAKDEAVTVIENTTTEAVEVVKTAEINAVKTIEETSIQQREVFEKAVETADIAHETAEDAREIVDELQDRLSSEDINIPPLKRSAESRYSTEQYAPEGSENVAITDSSNAFGVGTKAGCKGYYISRIYYGDDSNKPQVKVAVNQPGRLDISTSPLMYDSMMPNYPAYSKGHQFNIICGDHYIYIGTVESMDYDIITFTGDITRFKEGIAKTASYKNSDGSPMYATLTDTSFILLSSAVGSDDYTLFVPEAPEIGAIDVSIGGIAAGKNTKAAGVFSVATGRDTVAAEGYGNASGRGTVAGYIANAHNLNTKALGHYSNSFGEGTEALNTDTMASGYETKAKGWCSTTGGFRTETTEEMQVAYGKYNKVDKHSLFMYGDGKSYDNLSNAFEIRKENGIRSMLLGDVEVSEEALKSITMSVPRYTVDGTPIDPSKQYVARYISGMWLAVEEEPQEYTTSFTLKLYDLGSIIQKIVFNIGQTWSEVMFDTDSITWRTVTVEDGSEVVIAIYNSIPYYVLTPDGKNVKADDMVVPASYKFLCVEHVEGAYVIQLATREQEGIKRYYCVNCGWYFHDYNYGVIPEGSHSLVIENNGVPIAQASHVTKTINSIDLDPRTWHLQPPEGKDDMVFMQYKDKDTGTAYMRWEGDSWLIVQGASININKDTTLLAEWGYGISVYAGMDEYPKACGYYVRAEGYSQALPPHTNYIGSESDKYIKAAPAGKTFGGYLDLDTGDVYKEWDKVTLNRNYRVAMIWGDPVTITYVNTNGASLKTISTISGGSFTVLTNSEAGSSGNRDYWVGSDGNTYYSGQLYSVVSDLTLTAVYVQTHSHSYSDYVNIGSGQHAQKCACGELKNVGPHSFGSWSAYTDSGLGVMHKRSCTTCGYVERTAEHQYEGYDEYTTDSQYCNRKCCCGATVAVEEHAWVAIGPDATGLKTVYECSRCGATRESY